jgi:predicted small metal-binding protein
MGINSSATSSSYGLYVTGNIYTTGVLTQYSDVRKKTDIVTIDNALEKVIRMRGVYFTKIGEKEKGRQTGVIAQEINEILPEVVIHAKDVDEYSVAYGNAIGVLIEAIKELNVKLDEANKQIENLKQ